MSEAPAKKGLDIDKILLGTAGILILGMLIFGSSGDSHDKASAKHSEDHSSAEQPTPETDKDQTAVIQTKNDPATTEAKLAALPKTATTQASKPLPVKAATSTTASPSQAADLTRVLNELKAISKKQDLQTLALEKEKAKVAELTKLIETMKQAPAKAGSTGKTGADKIEELLRQAEALNKEINEALKSR